MACASCAERRARIAEAKSTDGWKGVARIVPIIAREMVVPERVKRAST